MVKWFCWQNSEGKNKETDDIKQGRLVHVREDPPPPPPPVYQVDLVSVREDVQVQIVSSRWIDRDVFAGPFNPKDGSAANIIGSSFYGFKWRMKYCCNNGCNDKRCIFHINCIRHWICRSFSISVYSSPTLSVHSQARALQEFYQRNKARRNEQKLRQCHLAARVGVPAVVVSLVLVYWATGLTSLSRYYFPHVWVLISIK